MIPEIPGFGLWEGWIYTFLITVMVVGAGRDRTRAITIVRTVAIAAIFVWIHFAVFYRAYYGYPLWYTQAAAGALLAVLFPCIVLLKKFGDRADAAERREKNVT